MILYIWKFRSINIYSIIWSFNGIDSKLSLRNERQEFSKLIRRSFEIIVDVKSRWRKLKKKRTFMIDIYSV